MPGLSAPEEILRRGKIFVQASSYEGLPHAVLEAKAHGLPVVATRVGANGDLIVADAFTLARCLDQLAEVLSYGREVDSPETHDLTFIGCKRVEDIEPVISEAADRWVATGGVMFEANVCCTA